MHRVLAHFPDNRDGRLLVPEAPHFSGGIALEAMVQKLICLIVIAYVPGALIYRAPIANRDARASLPAEERLFWAITLSVIVSTTIALALAAIGIYSLAALVACNVVLAIGVALASFGDLRLSPGAPKPGRTAAFPAVLVAAGMWMYFAAPASEYVLGGRDPGVYMIEGIQIAQQRSLVTPDLMASAVPASTRDLFFPKYGEPGYYSLRFMGFHLRDPDSGIVSGQFPQGYPIWIAIAYGLDGITGTRRVVAWWAIFGVLAVYFAGARLIGRLPAAASAGLLTIHVLQTWYARYPNSEIVTQGLLFGALLGHAYAHEDEDRFFGPLAASLLGLALFTRFQAVLAAGAAVTASLLAPVNGRRPRAGFLITLAAWSGAAGVYYMTQLRPYFSNVLAYLHIETAHLLLLTGCAAVVCALLWSIRKPQIAAATRQWLPICLIAVVSAGAAYGLFFRQPGGPLAAQDAFSVRTFANFYLTSTALGLALAGYAIVVWRSFWRAPALILMITTCAFLFFYKLRIFPEHFWLARRFIPEILPGSLIFASAAVFAPLWILPRQQFRNGRSIMGVASVVIGMLAILALSRPYLAASQPIRRHIEYASLIPHIEQLAARFGDDDLVLVEAREASDVHALALPLAYIYARNVLVLHSSRPDKPAVSRFLNWARQRYKGVYFIAGGGTDLLLPGIGAQVVDSERFQVSEYEKTPYDRYPRAAVLKPFDFTIYRLVESSVTTPPHSLDIGGADDLHLVDFHPKERLGGGDLTFRWTRDSSSLLMGVGASSRELILRLSSGRPRGVAAPRISIYLQGRELGSIEPTADWRDYAFPISAALASELAQRSDPSEIRIQSTIWVPNDVTDDRALGVMVDRAEIR